MADPSTAMFHGNTQSRNRKVTYSSRAASYNVQNNYSGEVFKVSDVIGYIGSAIKPVVALARQSTSKLGRNPAEISAIMAQNSTSLPVSSIADRYTRSMLCCMVGYPLHEPEPFSEFSEEYTRKGVNVGDVGIIRADGTFDFLFNICPPRNGSINPPNLPPGFSLSEHSKTKKTRAFPPNTSFFPPTVTKTKSSEYTCKGSEGAILALPDGAIQEEATNKEQFEELAKRHGVEWYHYTKSRGRSISNGSLYLVTSYTKCSQWGIAVFDRPSDRGQALTFVSHPLGWKGMGASTTKVAYPNQENKSNQCVFLRGYKIMIRQDIFDRLTRGGAHHGGGTSFMSKIKDMLTCRCLTTVPTTMSEKVVLHADFNSSPAHPSDLINAELLSQNPKAKIALTHDDVWCDLLQDNFPKPDYAALITKAQSYTTVVDHGCVSLQK